MISGWPPSGSGGRRLIFHKREKGLEHLLAASAQAFRSPVPPKPGLPRPAGERVSGLRHVPLAFTGAGWFRRKARARTVPSPEGFWHSLLPWPDLPATASGSAVPPVPGFGRFRHLRVSENAHKPLTF